MTDLIENQVARPKTRGELFENLQNGIKSEIVASNAEITSALLKSLNIIRKTNVQFKIVPSANQGYCIFESVK